MNAAGLACVASVGVLLVAEVRGARGLRGVAKCGAALAMVVCGVTAGAGATSAGRRVLAGLVLSAAGDAALLGSSRRMFGAGLALFAAAHVAYASAALRLGVSWPAALGVGIAAFVLTRKIWRWLSPHVPTSLRIAVWVYMLLITAMATLAVAATLAGNAPPQFSAGAVLFFVSDLAVARDRFVVGSVLNRLWGLPAYFGAQLLIATSL